jgi:hypothetical protein
MAHNGDKDALFGPVANDSFDIAPIDAILIVVPAGAAGRLTEGDGFNV